MGDPSAPIGAPLARFVAWYEALSAELRDHLEPHLFDAEPAGAGPDGAAASALRGPLACAAGDPAREAELVVRLAVRTDAVLADVAIREQWTAEAVLVSGGADEAARARTIARTLEWMRAVEHWTMLRLSGLAGRRIERWLAKRDPVRRAG